MKDLSSEAPKLVENMKQDYDLLNRILNCLHDQVALIGKDMRIHYYNQAFESFLLLNLMDSPDIESGTIEELFPASLSPIIEAVQECFRNGQITNRTIELDYMHHKSFYKLVVIPQHSPEGVNECIIILYSNTEAVLKSMELKQQLQFLSKLISKLPVGIYMFDRLGGDMSLSLWNPKMRDFFGMDEAEVMGKSIESVFNGAFIGLHKKAIEHMDHKGSHLEFPAEAIKTAEGMKYLQMTLAPIQAMEGEISNYSYLGIVEDVSEKIAQEMELKRYQKELKESLKNTSEKLTLSNAEIASIMENSYGISIFSLDRDMRYRVFNPHHQYMMMRRFGKDITEGMLFPEQCLQLSDRDTTVKELYENALSGKSIAKEVYFILPDHTELYMDAVVSPLYSEDAIIGVTAVLFDTTEQRRTEKEAEIFKSVAENAEYGVFLTDMDFDIHYANHYLSKLMNHPEKELMGNNLHTILEESQIRRIKNRIKLSKGNGSKTQLELDLNVRNSTTITLLMNFVQYNEISGNPGGFAFTCLDITPMRKAREALVAARDNAERSSILKSSFVANMSHEIRTPLNAILGFAELMNGRMPDPQLDGHLQNILSSGQILKGLINDILDFSKIEAGKMQYTPFQENIILFFRELFNLFSLQARDKMIHFEIDSIGEVPEILIYDPVRLRQILMNLMGNALKFTRQGYVRLIVKYELSKETLLLSVEDTGIGIPRSDQADIFNPFEQQEKQDSRTFEGTGLGLSITKKLVELMKGKMQLKSDRFQGSQFKMALPVAIGGSDKSEVIRYRERLFREEEHFICFVEDALLTKQMKKYGQKNQIDFSPLSGMEQIQEDNNDAKIFILIKGESNQLPSARRFTLIRIMEHDEMLDKGDSTKEYRLSSRLETEKILYMVHSIMRQEITKKDAGLLDFKVLNTQELNVIKKAIDTKNFQDIDEALPYIHRCENREHLYSESLKEAVSSFDIPKLNKIMEQVQENYIQKDV